MTTEMKAVIYDEVGGPEVLRLSTVPKPKAAPGEVVVRVRACALNLLDYYLRIAKDPEMPMPHIMGSDISGVVDSIGDGVSGWQPEDPVVVAAAIEVEGGRPKIIGYQTQGGYAQFCSVPAQNLIRKPDCLSFEEAASIPLVYVTAYHQMFTQGGLKCGQTVLVMGGSGGVGSAAIQLCKAAGAFVISTVGSKVKVDQAREIGADVVVDHSMPNWDAEILRATDGRGVDLICEHLGGDFVPRCIKLLAHGGTLVTIGATTGTEVSLNLVEFFRKEVKVVGSYMGSRRELLEVMKLFEWGLLKPVISRVFPLAEVQEAHRYLESRQHFGKIVLTID